LTIIIVNDININININIIINDIRAETTPLWTQTPAV
jgi:hypothetical protein